MVGTERSVANQNRATVKQVAFYRGLYVRAGMPLHGSRLKAFKMMTVGMASLEIQRVKQELDTFALATYNSPSGMATARQLRYFSKLRHRLGEPVTPGEIEELKQKTTSQMQQVNVETMRRLQEKNDANGVPLPTWRLERGLYDADFLREGQRRAAARQAEKWADVEARIQKRQEQASEQRPPSKRKQVYPGEYV